MQLAGNIAVLETSVPLLDFAHQQQRFIKPASSRPLRAWAKLAEAERRLDHFDWLTFVARGHNIAVTATDFAVSYLLTFEATLQILAKEAFGDDQATLGKWLDGISAYDLTCRGLRTLRNLEAHIRAGVLHAAAGRPAHSRLAGGIDPGATVPWQFAPIGTTEYNELKPQGRKLRNSEFGAWNSNCEAQHATDVMFSGLKALHGILAAA